MSKKPIRLEKTCLNCDHLVPHRYCENCGQENIETRRSFHHLFTRFFLDLTHYDNAFWKTIYNLMFKPAALSKAYLSGKRLQYLNPIQLYVFISFITFLIVSVFSIETNVVADIPKENGIEKEITKAKITPIDSIHFKEKSIDGLTKIGLISQGKNDTLKKILDGTNEINSKRILNLGLENIAEMDSLRKKGSKNITANSTKYQFIKKLLKIEEEQTEEEIFKDFSTAFNLNLPKVLFIYMPIFAFILWLFHNKKKWYYFDHGIFTLHYFSFLLLMILMLFFINKLEPLMKVYSVLGWFHFGLSTAGYFYMFYYFFPAHRRFYGDRVLLSFFKSSLVYIISILVFSVMVLLFSLYMYLHLN
ncbi:DUF3667 domain-containing protein [Polaribacter glomeratus]|uniref:DUF3667 domain-containing protein n=1 Tax=Polaribacter glomeratus TaxID=102 RepID=A0A2S7WZM7_9FLAO|nr:DUF3667 domain-containing protein [Polaribacter glomeratus]PQJ82822.1 hypothetical protein BTO16_09640 [Polaribacter glomeratus]TXD65364.1 DUF3667 domain-containing protein [Polaribacter glomeratus]